MHICISPAVFLIIATHFRTHNTVFIFCTARSRSPSVYGTLSVAHMITIFLWNPSQRCNEHPSVPTNISLSRHHPPPPANPLRLFCCFPLTELSAGSRWYSWSNSSSTAVPSAEMQANLRSEFRKKNTPGGLLWPAAISSFFSSIFPPSYSSVNLITAYCFLPPALHKAERLFSVILRYFLQGRSEVRLLRW